MPVLVRDAATLLLVRDAPAGSGPSLEVLLLRRALDAVFVGGAHVFPGGAVDDGDRLPEVEEVSEGLTDERASALLGMASGGLAYWAAAVRESFEEAGVLLAYRRPGELLTASEPGEAERLRLHRESLLSGRRNLVEVCREEGVRLALDRVHHWSRWITPEGPPRRFDTRFFVARAPRGQVALHDPREADASLWTTPGAALAGHRRGELVLVTPTLRSLQDIDRFASASELLEAASRREGSLLG